MVRQLVDCTDNYCTRFSLLVRRRSDILPSTYEISCERFDSNLKSQKRLERGELTEREVQQMSGKLKSPMMMRRFFLPVIGM